MMEQETRKGRAPEASTELTLKSSPQRGREGKLFAGIANIQESCLYSGGEIIASDKLVQGIAASVRGEKAAE